MSAVSPAGPSLSAEAAQTVALIGGSGAQGQGLALRMAAAGVPVLLGSRRADRAEESAAALKDSKAAKSDNAPHTPLPDNPSAPHRDHT